MIIDRKRLRRILPFLVLAASGFVLAYVLVAFVVLPVEVEVEDVRVPSVVGLAYADAQRRLMTVGLKGSLGEARFSADAPKSTVLSQTPPAGTPQAIGSTILLDVSEGQQRSTMPALTGLTRDDAERALKEAGLHPGQFLEQASDAPRGRVLQASPEPGQVVPRGTRVDLVLSAGPAELTMPDVVGRDLDTAKSLLQQLGLRLEPLEHDSLSTLPVGTVIAQSPAAGAPIATGAAVAMRVSGRP